MSTYGGYTAPVPPSGQLGIGGPFASPFQNGLFNSTNGAASPDLNSAIAAQASPGYSNVLMGPGYSQQADFLSGGPQMNAPTAPASPGVGTPAGTPAPQQMTALDQLLAQEQQQMQSIGNIGNYEMPYSTIQGMAQNLTNAQYDPQINNLLGQIAQQKQQSGINQNYASQMYNALGDSYIQDIPQVQAQVQQEQQATKDQYSQAQQALQQNYQNQSSQQQQALDKLGIQAAQGGGSSGGNGATPAQNAPGVQGVGQQQSTDQKYLQGQLQLQQQQAANLLTEQGQSANQYQTSMADSSKMQGANDVQLLRNALSNYLTGANTQEQSLVGAKANALSGMEGQLQWQNIQNAQTQYQNAFNRVMAQNQFGLGVQQEQDTNTNNLNTILAQLQENQNQYGLGTVNRPGTTGNMGGPEGAATQLAQQFSNGGSGMNAKDSSTILQAIDQTMQQVASTNQSNIKLGMRPLPSDMSTYNGILQQQLQQDGITNPNEIAAAYQALLAYNQQLK